MKTKQFTFIAFTSLISLISFNESSPSISEFSGDLDRLLLKSSILGNDKTTVLNK